MTIDADMDYRRCAFAHNAQNMFYEYTGIRISAKTLSEIIGECMDNEVSEVLYDPNSPYMDTCIREQVLDMISEHYIGRSWPTYSEMADMNEFQIKLESAILGK